MDKYQIGVTTNSESTMHKLASTEITLDCFEIGDYENNLAYYCDDHGDGEPFDVTVEEEVEDYILFLERLRKKYAETKDKRYWKELVRWLPESWLQMRTTTMNYENLHSICHQRQGHKLTEWARFIEWAHTLPYSEDLIFYDGK